MMGIDVLTAGSDVDAILLLQASIDGTNFITAATVIADTNPHQTGVKQAMVDLTAISSPYLRLVFNSSGLATGALGRFKFLVTGVKYHYERA
jgi:hypothetical protein